MQRVLILDWLLFSQNIKKKIGTQVTHLAGCRTLADPKKIYTSLSK